MTPTLHQDLAISPRHVPELHPEYIPAALWTREFLALCRKEGERRVVLALMRPDGTGSIHLDTVLPAKPVSKEVLYSFYRQCHPGGPGWAKVLLNAREEGVDLNGAEGIDWQMPLKLLCVFIVAEGLPLPHLSH
jgi:hypothetical protein